MKKSIPRLILWVLLVCMACAGYIQAGTYIPPNEAAMTHGAQTDSNSSNIDAGIWSGQMQIEGIPARTAEVKPGLLEAISKFVVDPIIRTVLLTIGILGLMLEIVTLSGVAGSIGLTSLILFFISHITTGLTPWWVVIVFFIGVILLALEIFVIPGFGVTGASGVICTFTSMYLAMSANNPGQAAVSLLVATVVSASVFAGLFKYLPKSKAWDRISLSSRQTKEEGYMPAKERKELEGEAGTAITDLRPSGTALINNEKIDVISDGAFITKDTPLQVVKVEGIKIIVKKI